MPETVFQGDLFVNGNLRAISAQLPTSAVTNASVVAGAGIDATKLQHQHNKTFSQPNTAATTETKVIHVAYGAGTVIAFRAGSIAIAVGGATVTLDLKKNGTTVLSAVITLDTGNVARVAEAGTVSVTAYAAGDVFEVVATATAGGGTLPTGLFAHAVFNENPS